MSRTYRKEHLKCCPHYLNELSSCRSWRHENIPEHFYDGVICISKWGVHSFHIYTLNHGSKAWKRNYALLTKDGKFCGGGPPKKYVRGFSKSIRRHDSLELHRFIKYNGEYEVMINANHHNSAKWDWA